MPTDPATPTEPVAWHALSPDEALGRLSSNASGLGAADAAQRLEIHGRNELDLGTGSTGPGEWGVALAVGFTGLVASSAMTAIDRTRER